MHGQGKWYPGEPLPRWEIRLLWRSDGQPLWTDPALLDEPWTEPRLEAGSAAAADAVETLTKAIAARLGVPDRFTRPLYEDPLERLAAEAALPAGPPPPAPGSDVWPADGDRRAALVAALDAERGLPTALGDPAQPRRGRADVGHHGLDHPPR